MKKKWFGRKAKSYSSRITLEQLEERIVLDASVPATSVDNPDNPDNQQVEHQAQQANTPDAQNAPTQAAAEAATSSDPLGQIYNQDTASVVVSNDLAKATIIEPASRLEASLFHGLDVVLVSDSVKNFGAVSKAVTPDTISIIYDSSKDTLQNLEARLDELVSSSGSKIEHLAIVSHGEPGILKLTDDQIFSSTSVTDDPVPWQMLGSLLEAGARIDFYGCNVGSGSAGFQFVESVSNVTGAVVWASSDSTGSMESGNWELEIHSGDSNLPYILDSSSPLLDGVSLSNSSVVNGSFETHDYTGWLLSEQGGSYWGIASDGQTISVGQPITDYFGMTTEYAQPPVFPQTYHSTDGSLLAFTGDNGADWQRMTQTLDLNPDVESISWDMQYVNYSGTSSDNQYLKISLGSYTLFDSRNSGVAQSLLEMTHFSREISSLAGQHLNLQIEVKHQVFYYGAAFDNFDLNHQPTNLFVEPSAVDENLGSGFAVGALTTVDRDANQSHTYSLVYNDAYPDNAAFTIDGNELKTAADFNSEHQNSYTINVQTDDGHGGTFVKEFTINVNDGNDLPTAIALSGNSINENSGIGAVVGTLSTTDQDSTQTHTYTLVNGNAYPGNAAFTIEGNLLKTATDFNFEGQNSYTISIQTDDGNGGTFVKEFTINVSNLNEAPNAIPDIYAADEDTPLTVAVYAGVLNNDSDEDTDTLTAFLQTGPSHGTLELNLDGSFYYSPNQGFYGVDTFTYVAEDGTVNSGQATVSIVVMEAWPYDLHGTSDVDSLTINSGETYENVYAWDGDDILHVSGNVRGAVYGGEGNDTLTIEGFSNLRIYGDAADGWVAYGLNQEIHWYGFESLSVIGTDGSDVMTVTAGSQLIGISGGLGNDQIYNSGSVAQISGGDGDDILINQGIVGTAYGDSGNDQILNVESSIISYIYGGLDDDLIENHATVVSGIQGGDGNDSIRLYGGSFNGTLLGGEGQDDIAIGHYGDMEVWGNGSSGSVLLPGSQTLSWQEFEFVSITGSDGGNDTIIVHTGASLYAVGGWAGNDSIIVESGAHVNSVDGGYGKDSIDNYGYIGSIANLGGDDTITNSSGALAAYIDGSMDNEIIANYGTVLYDIRSGHGDDFILNHGTMAVVYAGSGNDEIINFGTLTSFIELGDGDDSVSLFSGQISGIIDGGPESNGDTLYLGQGFSSLVGDSETGSANFGNVTLNWTAFEQLVLANHAPVLDDSATFSLSPISEDQQTIPGTTVADILSSGGSGAIADLDTWSVSGMAVTSADGANGQWWYSTNGGSNWYIMSNVSESSAILLANQSDSLIRFMPNDNYFGVSTISFHAWDQSIGINGDTDVDVTYTGGSTAFSEISRSASVSISPLNDAPTDIVLIGATINENSGIGTSVGSFLASDIDNGDPLTYHLVAGEGDANNLFFFIEGSVLKTAYNFDYETGSFYSIRVQTDDGHGGTFEEVFTISVNDVNDYPTDIAISSNSVAENLPIGTLVGDLSTIDEDGGPNYTYSIAGGSTYLDNSKFTISGNQLLTAMKFNFENKSLYQVNVQADDGNGGAVEKIFDIHVSDANDRPTNILLSTDTINENSGAGALVATLSTVDQDAWQTHSYSLLNTADKNYFTISGNELRTTADFDFETDNSYTIKIKTTDQEGATYNKEFEIKVADANDNPTGISLNNSNVDENLPVGSVVGTLLTDDQDGGQSHVYTLINDPVNFPDNALFTIDGLILKTNAVFDHETTDQFSIAIQTEDNHGGRFVQQLYININDTNDIPAEIRLSSNLIDENLGSNAVVGTLSTEDQDVVQTFSYELVSGNGANDNASFRIEGDILKTVDNLDYETRNLYSIRIQTDDGNGGSLERVFTIAVADGNDLPTGINLNTTTIPENSGTGAVIGIFSSDDQDTAQNHVYSLVSGLGDYDNSSFEINGLQLKATENFNYEIHVSYSIRVQTDDGHGGFFEKVFIISVEDVNDTPSDISLTSNTVSENMPVGTIIGTLGVSDEDEGQGYGYTLTDSANFNDNQFFEIVGDQLVTKASFNFEARESYQIKVQVNDGNTGGTFDKELEIFVQDANDTPSNITLSSYSIQENSGLGAIVGILQTSDEDVTQTHSYSLVNGGAYPDNLKFLIVGDELRTASDFDHEIKDSYLIRVKSNDGNGGSVTRNLTISVADINEAPTVNAPPSASYLEDAAIVAIPGIVVNDQDDGAIVTATLTLGDHENAGVINSAHVASNSEGVWQFSGAVDALNAELASLAFRPNHNYDVNTSIKVLVSDGELSDSRDISLDVTPSSDKSTLNISDTSFVFVVGDNTPINVGAGSNIIVDDPDTGDTLTVKLTWNKQTGSVVYDGGTDSDGLLEFTGDESTVNALLESVAFSPKDGLSKDTSLTVAVKDTDGISFDATKTISLKKNFQTSVQTWDTSISQWVSFNEGAPYIRDYVEGYDKVFLPAIRIIDGDSNETVTVTLKLDDVSTGYLTSKTNYTKDTIYNESTGVWTYTGKVSNVNTMLGKVVFVPGDDTDINSSISVRISDGDSDPIEGTIILDVTPRNDIPVFVSLPETEDGVISYNENSASVSLAGISIADPDTAENDITVTVKVYEPDTGALNLASAAEPGAVVADYQVVDGIGVWSVTGTVEQVNKTLDRLLFIPQTDNDANSSLSIEVTDHEYDYTVKEYLNLEVIPAEGVNDPIEAGFIISGQLKPITFEPTVQYKEGYDNVYLPTIVVSDDDPDDLFTAVFTLQNTDTRVTISPDYFKDVIGHVETYYNATPLIYKGAGVWSLENVNMADLNYALSHLRFQPTDYNDHNARLDIVIKDDAETSVSASVTLKVIARNSQASFTDTPDSVINYDEDSAPFVLKTTENGTDHFLRVDDPDTGEKLTATVTLSDTGVGSMTSTYSFGGTTHTIPGSTSGIWAIKNKSVEEVNLALENLKFAPKANNEKDAWFSVEVKDGGENATVKLYREFDLKVNPGNDQVKVSGDPGVATAAPVKYQGDMKLKTQLDLPDIKVVDIDTKEKVKATFTLNVDPSWASLSRFSTPDNYAYQVTDGVGKWTFEDTIDNLNTAIKDLKFIPQDDLPSNFNGQASISVKIEDGLENGTSAKNGSIFIDYGTKTSWWDLLE